MSMKDTSLGEHRCPHCGALMRRWRSPDDSSWGGAVKLVCWNDLCPYYVRGWETLREQQAVECSYRHMLDPETGYTGPLAVWSPDARKESIID